MNNLIILGKAATYSKKKTRVENISLESFVSVDNMLQNKTGITNAEKLPAQGGMIPAFEINNILVGNIRPYLKKIWFADKNGGCSADVLVFDVNQNYYPRYIYYAMFRNDFFEHMMRGKKGTKMPRGNKEQILNYLIPDYKYSDQQKIADVLVALDSKIKLNNCINAELEAMAKTLYDYWFVQFDFPNAKGKPYKTSGGKMVWNEKLKREIPVGWEAKNLSSVTDVSTESINPFNYPDKEFRYCSIPTFDEIGTYGFEKGSRIKSNKFVVSERDVLVSKLNPWFSRAIYSTGESDLICSTEFVVWRSQNVAQKNYLYMIARDVSFISYCTKSATGTSNSHKRVNPTVMMKYKVAYNKQIAELFGLQVGAMIKMCAKNRVENKNLSDLRDWLLPMLMNGQITVGNFSTANYEILLNQEKALQ